MLAETVAEAARRFGDRAVVVADGGWSLTYADLDGLSDEVAAWMTGRGIGPGDVVALVLPPIPEHFVAFAAAAKVGAVTASVNPRLAPPEREAVLAVAGPALVLATAQLAPQDAAAGATVDVVSPGDRREDCLTAVRVAGAAPPALPADPDRPVALVFTSGTTGLPKGAVFAGRQIDFVTATDVGKRWDGGGPALAGSTLSHLGPMTKLEGALRRGSTQYLAHRWTARAALERMDRLRIAVAAGVPAQIALMLRDPDFDGFDLSCVKSVIMGGGPATPSLIREARERFDAPVYVRYSCTEAGIGTGTGPADPDDDAEVSVGRPQPGVTVRIVDTDGGGVRAGEIGEVCLASPAVMDGYWNDVEATRAAFVDGGAVRTGDLGWIDDVGRLRLAGRLVERYVRGGYNVHPVEVEAVLADHDAVAAVAVVGRPDPVMGEIGVAVVVARPGRPVPDVESLRDHAASRLARHKLPDAVVEVPALPLTPMEKVDRRALAALAAAEPGAPVSGAGRGSGGR